MKVETRKVAYWAVAGGIIMMLAVLSARASSQTSMIPRSSEGWSRGKVVGHTPVKQQVALQPAPNGGVFLLWQNMEKQFELAHIDADGEVLLSQVLPVEAYEAYAPQLQVGVDGRLHLLWRDGKYPRSTVLYLLVSADGTPASQPQSLSEPQVAGSVLDAPRLVRDGQGRHHAVWADETGIQWAVLSAEGALLSLPTLLVPEGRFPAVQWDDRALLHLTWRQEKRNKVWTIHYATLEPESGVVGRPEEISEVHLKAYHRLRGPTIGLTPETGYVFWEVNDHGYVYSHAEFASFPLRAPEQSQIEPFDPRRGGDPSEIYPLTELETPLLVTLSENVPDPEAGELRSQIAIIALERQAMEDIVTGSSRASLKPAIIKDDRSRMHLAWLETAGFGEYQVAYASTALGVKQTYNALTLRDVSDVVLDKMFRLSTMVVTLAGTLALWAIIPFLGLLVYHLVTSEETLSTQRSWCAVIAALAAEVALTFLLPPRIRLDHTGPALRWIVPATSAGITAAVMVRLVRRKESHLFGTFFQFTIMNSILQTALFLLF